MIGLTSVPIFFLKLTVVLPFYSTYIVKMFCFDRKGFLKFNKLRNLIVLYFNPFANTYSYRYKILINFGYNVFILCLFPQ